MLTYATRSALLLRPLIQSTRATARALSATPYLDRTQQGPVWPTLTQKPDEKTLEKDGKGVCAWLGSASSKPADLDAQLAARVYDLYLPVYYWCKDVVEKNPTKPTVIFMSAPQGCGKTTICDALVERFAADGKQCAALSYDDFYLTHAEQNEVAKTHEHNRLLELRGNGGTHDLQLFDDVLTALKRDGKAKAPRYDKTAFGGFGDRAGLVDVEGADVVLVEGWMAGFKPVASRVDASTAPRGSRSHRRSRGGHGRIDAGRRRRRDGSRRGPWRRRRVPGRLRAVGRARRRVARRRDRFAGGHGLRLAPRGRAPRGRRPERRAGPGLRRALPAFL